MLPPTKSRFITILAVVSIAAAFFAVVQAFSTLSLQNSPEFGIVRQLMPSAIISPAAIYFEIFLNIAGIAASAGLYLRLNWGRILYMAVLTLFTVWSIYQSISTYLAFDDMMGAYGLGGSLSLILFWSLLGLGINIFLLWKLSSYEVRLEFEKAKEQRMEISD